MARYDAAIEEVFESYDPTTLLRGREYADDGRVTVSSRDAGTVRAVVRGSQPYDVTIGEDRETCTCPAFDREGRCKHIAALAHLLRRGRSEAAPPSGALPAIYRSVYSASSVLGRLGLYAGVAAVGPEPDRWLSLADWFWRTRNKRVLLDHTAEIETVLERLHVWLPAPAAEIPTTGFEVLYAQLAELYASHAEDAELRHALPGPLDDRHPGWEFAYDSKRRTFEARERAAPLLERPMRLVVSVALAPGQPLRFENQAFASYSGADAWEVFALRAMLIALHAPDGKAGDAVRALRSDLARPLWEHVLDDLTPKNAKNDEGREWRFAIAPTYHDYAFTVTAYSRSTSGRASKWKKQPFDALFATDRDDEQAEREIARVALCSVEARNESMLRLATPQGHELARLLATHPGTVFAPNRGQIEVPLPARLIVGTLTLHLDRADASGVLTPQLFVNGVELPFPPAMLAGTGMFRGGAQLRVDSGDGGDGGITIVSAQAPAALRAWLDALAKMGSALAFPPEAVPKLVAQPVIQTGVISLPREALGQELAAEPRAAIRVEWRPDGALIEPLIAVHPRAPLVAPGAGARLFTFELDGKRVFVERDLESESAIVEAGMDGIDAPIGWTPTGGVVEGIRDMIALAAWLDANPLAMPIEVKKGGRSPEVVSLAGAGPRIQVQKRGSWLRLDGELDVAGTKLTFGDVLEAARHARRYVKAADGVFLELSQEAIAKLQPIAIAAALAPANDNAGAGAIVHDAFGTLLAEARSLFSEVKEKNVDLDAYMKRFSARGKAVRAPALENGALRPYQKDGVEWMLQLATWAPGCVLADDMGLGKTVQTACVLKARAKLGPALVVAPASVTGNWVSELARFMPTLEDVTIVSYGQLQRDREAYAKKKWATVIVDEAQYVKNYSAARTDAVRSLNREFSIALTGTPLENHLGELFSIIDIVFPGLLGDEQGFREQFRRPIEQKKDPDRLATLSRLIAPFLLRRTRAAVLRELPAREEITERLELSAAEQKQYLALRRACEEQFARGKRKKGETPAQFRIALLAALTRLRQLACDPRLVDKAYDGPLTKLARVVELTTELAAEGNHALVFSQFTSFLEKVRDALTEAGLRVAYLAGDTPRPKRQALVEAFQRGEYDVFCVSLLAGGTGLNLTRASYVVHLDPWWNPASEEQATSRAHRMGQDVPVTVYRLVARGTIEEAVLEMHDAKKKLASAVLEGKGDAKAISEHELLELLRFGV